MKLTQYEANIIKCYDDRSLAELKIMQEQIIKKITIATGDYQRTGLSKYKEDKEHSDNRYEILSFVIANRDF
jgi:hypothetical protein